MLKWGMGDTGIRVHKVIVESPTISLDTETTELLNQGSLSFPLVGTGFMFHTVHIRNT